MNVQELIDELMKIEDKTIQVVKEVPSGAYDWHVKLDWVSVVKDCELNKYTLNGECCPYDGEEKHLVL